MLETVSRDKANNMVERAVEAVERARGQPNEAELRAIAFGKLQAVYSLGLVDDKSFFVIRKYLGY